MNLEKIVKMRFMNEFEKLDFFTVDTRYRTRRFVVHDTYAL